MPSDECNLPANLLESEQKRQDNIKIIKALPSGQRMVINLFYLEDMHIAEIAQVMGSAQGTIKAQLYQARQAIATAVLSEEERGNKLYAAAGLPVIAQILKAELENATSVPTEISEAVMQGIQKALSDMAPQHSSANTTNLAEQAATQGAGAAQSAAGVAVKQVGKIAGMSSKAKIAIACAGVLITVAATTAVISHKAQGMPKTQAGSKHYDKLTRQQRVL